VNLNEYLTQRPWSQVGAMPMNFYPLVMGLAFLLPSEVAFSLWFFFLFYQAEVLAGRRLQLGHARLHREPESRSSSTPCRRSAARSASSAGRSGPPGVTSPTSGRRRPEAPSAPDRRLAGDVFVSRHRGRASP
jgi:hypothetical protein